MLTSLITDLFLNCDYNSYLYEGIVEDIKNNKIDWILEDSVTDKELLVKGLDCIEIGKDIIKEVSIKKVENSNILVFTGIAGDNGLMIEPTMYYFYHRAVNPRDKKENWSFIGDILNYPVSISLFSTRDCGYFDGDNCYKEVQDMLRHQKILRNDTFNYVDEFYFKFVDSFKDFIGKYSFRSQFVVVVSDSLIIDNRIIYDGLLNTIELMLSYNKELCNTLLYESLCGKCDLVRFYLNSPRYGFPDDSEFKQLDTYLKVRSLSRGV